MELWLSQVELRDDIFLHKRGCGRRHAYDRGGTEMQKSLRQHPVIGSEVMTPLRDTMRFIDCDQGGWRTG